MSFARKDDFHSFSPCSSRNLDNEDGRPVVADPRGHLRQALVVRGRRVQEAPVLSVLQQKVRIDEQDAGELKFFINLEMVIPYIKRETKLNRTLHGQDNCSFL